MPEAGSAARDAWHGPTRVHPDIRSFAFKGYVIYFRYVGNTFEVVNVLEGHRDAVAYFHDDGA